MDFKTLDSYNKSAALYTNEWANQPLPTEMYELFNKFLHPGGKTADIGCGSGRDTNWLYQQGYQVSGFDGSSKLVELARQAFPNLVFNVATLPALSEVNETFDNIVCETVIMHLPTVEIVSALTNLKRILSDGGVLYLSWRVTEATDLRSDDDRLYSAFPAELVLNEFSNVLHFEDRTSESSGKRVCRLIYQA